MSDWIEWNGGECPVDEFTPIECRVRATYLKDGEQRNHSFRSVRPTICPSSWKHTGGDHDVIAYRPITHPYDN